MGRCPFEQFVDALYQSGLFSPREIQSYFDEIPEHECPSTAEELADRMVRSGMLTAFQAEALLDGKGQWLALGNYVILDRLSRGGMGRVFRGLHKRMKRVVALKILPPSKAQSDVSKDHFQREVEATARLAHPNIVTAFDAGEEKGVHFLVMEYVEGENLAQLVSQRGPLEVPQAVDYLLQAARGLEFAHWHGMVHRDIKPSNLIRDWRGTIKVVDFGLVHVVPGLAEPGAWGEGANGMPQETLFGTPDFMAPELVLDPQQIGPPCDIYSLGCTMYYLLVGKTVFAGETNEAKLRAHREESPPSLCAARPGVPAALDKLFQHMLAKRPEDRPATMAEVMAELEACVRTTHNRPGDPGRAPSGTH